jgi:hypothetical protein
MALALPQADDEASVTLANKKGENRAGPRKQPWKRIIPPPR